MKSAQSAGLTTDVLNLKDVQVIFFDLWLTLVHGLTTDPILTLQKSLSGDSSAKLDPDFLTTCLTTNINRPGRFLQQVAAKHSYAITQPVVAAFCQLVKAERSAAAKYPEVDATLAALNGCGYRLGLISNLWPFPVNRIFKQMRLGQHFEHCIFSFEVGYRKPSTVIFEQACQRFKVQPSQCLMVGDSLESDVKGALAAGMQAALILRPGGVLPAVPGGAFVISSLRELTV